MGYRILKPLFPLGNIYMTAGVAALKLDADEIGRFLHRHQCGDWGDLDDEDKQANESDLKLGERLLSRYDTGAGSLYVITERDRSTTTVLLRSEY
jgi:hypothetical protein